MAADNTPNDRALSWMEPASASGDIPRSVTDEGSATAEIQHTRQYVYNSGTLTWDRMTQPGAGGGGGGPVTIVDGGDVAQGTTTDAGSANTMVGLTKNIKAALAGTLTVGTHAVTGSGTFNVNLTGETAGVGVGAAADTSATNSVIGLLKKLISLLPTALGAGGGLKVDGSGTALPVSHAVSTQADGHSANVGALADASSASTLTGLLKAVNAILGTTADAAGVATLHGRLRSLVQPQGTGGNAATATSISQMAAGTDLTNRIIHRLNAKGTQGDFGLAVQNLRDAGRTSVAITSYQAASILTTEALFAAAAFSRSDNGAAPSTGVQFTVTAGKKFRIQSIHVTTKQTGAVATSAKLALRMLAAGGTITNASPIVAILDIGSNNAVAGNYMESDMAVPEGFEMPASATYGFTSLSSAVTAVHTITLLGYEY